MRRNMFPWHRILKGIFFKEKRAFITWLQEEFVTPVLSKTTDDVFQLALWRLKQQPHTEVPARGRRRNFHSAKPTGKWATESADRRKQGPLCSPAPSQGFWKAAPTLPRPPYEYPSSANLILRRLLFPWRGLSNLDVQMFTPSSVSLSCFPNSKFQPSAHFQEWICSPKTGPLDEPLDLPPWSLAPARDRQAQETYGQQIPERLSQRAISSTAPGEDCNNQFQTELPGSTGGAVTPVRLTKVNSIGFWYETFQWHSGHSVRGIVDASLYFPRWWGRGRLRNVLESFP